MKYILLFIVVFGIVSCTHSSQKNENLYSAYKYSGVITGIDLSNCVCCSGYVIKINGSEQSFRFYHFPPGSNVDSNFTAPFPIKVVLNYTETDTCGVNHFISIQAISKVD